MIARQICERVLQKAVSTGADFAELFVENTLNHTIDMVDSLVDDVTDARIAGASVRVFKGLRSVSATTVDTSEAGLLRCAEQAASALGEGTAELDIRLNERLFGDIHPVRIAPASVENARKVDILRMGCAAAKEYHEAIRQVTGTFLDVDHRILVVNSEGLYAQDRQIRTRLMVSAVAEINGETQTGGCRPGRRMGMPSTGSARRQSYAYVTTSRMTNTYIAPGTDRNEDIIGSIEYGLYAKEMGGGSVNPLTGEFNFAVNEGYMIRNGKVCEPVRGASLVGSGADVIQKIDMVGAELDLGQGMCGSSSGSIPTNVGQPMIRVSSITVGGR